MSLVDETWSIVPRSRSPSATVSAVSGSIVKVAKKQLVTLRKRIEQVITNMDVAATASHLDVPLLRHEDEQLSDMKTELKDIATPHLALDLPADHEVEGVSRSHSNATRVLSETSTPIDEFSTC